MKKVTIYYSVLLLLLFCVAIFFIYSFLLQNDESYSLVCGFIKDKNGILRDNIPVYLKNLDTGEQIVNLSYNGGFYKFDLRNLRHGWFTSNSLKIITSYLDPDGFYYYDYVYFEGDYRNKLFNLTANSTAVDVYVHRALPEVVLFNHNFTVRLTSNGVGECSTIWEKIPEGFIYHGCSLPEDNQDDFFAENNTVRFTLTGDANFSYYLIAPSDGGNYTFTGYFLDEYKNKHNVSWDMIIKVISAEINYPKDRFFTGENIPFSANVIGATPPYNITWYFSDINGNYEVRYGMETNYSYDLGGDYKILLVVIDNNSLRITNTTTIHVINKELSANLNVSYIAERGEEKKLSVAVSGGIPPYYCAWDLDNDGTYEKNGMEISKIWDSVGDYNISLKVNDSDSPPNTLTTNFVIYCQDTKLSSPTIKLISENTTGGINRIIILEYDEEVTIMNSTLDGETVMWSSMDNKTFSYNGNLASGDHIIIVEAFDRYNNFNTFNYNLKVV